MVLYMWAWMATYASLVAVGVESVQEKDVSSTILVVIALVSLTVFVRLISKETRAKH